VKKRVVVTGVGVISALGLKVADFWENLLRGKSGISEIESFSLAKFPFQRKYGGEIKNFQVADFVSNPAVSKYGRSTQMAIAAAKECLADAAYAVADDPFRIGVVLGTTMGEPLELAALDDVWHENFSQTVSGQTCDNYFFSKISQRTAKEFGICGPNLMLANACAAGNFSVAQACEYIR
jgi:3-oxoacyl-[acyl-carrier-protein] synthase II